jgi:hypothetical protein
MVIKSKENPSQHEKLVEMADHFNGVAIELLREGLKKIDQVHSRWEKKYDSLSDKLIQDIDVSNHERELSQCTIDETALRDIHDHIEKFEGYRLGTFISDLLEDPEVSLPGEVPYFKKDLNRDFWKIEKEDTFRIKMRKTWSKAHFFARKVRSRKNKGSLPLWGSQNYKPTLLTRYYFINPVCIKILALLEQRMGEHAMEYNALHLHNEKVLRSRISRALEKLVKDEEGSQKTNEKSPIEDQELNHEKRKLIPTKEYVAELETHLEKRRVVLLEQGEIAGTCLLKEMIFGEEEIEKSIKQLKRNADKDDEEWSAYFFAEGSDWIKDIEIITLQIQTLKITFNTISQLERKVADQVVPLLDELLLKVRKSFDRIKGSENSPQLRDEILKESRMTLRELRIKNITEVIDAYNKASFIKSVENFGLQINHRFNALNSDYTILQKLDIASLPPEINVRHINLKKIIETEYLDPVRKKTDEFTLNAEQSISDILRTLNEIGRMIQVNLETAMELLDDENALSGKKEDAGSMISEGLDRIYNIIEKIKPESQSIPGNWGREMSMAASSFIKGVDELSDNENIVNLILRQTKAEARESYAQLRKKTSRKLKSFFLNVWNIILFGLTGARSSYEQLSKITGTGVISESEMELMNFLYTTRNRISRLPFIYQRLYRLEELKDHSIFVGRDEELKRLDKCYEMWRSGNFASVAIIGENGSGRTSLINVAETETLKQNTVFRLKIPKGLRTEKELALLFAELLQGYEANTLNDLEDFLSGLERSVVIVVEDLQNLFVRTIGGFDLIERFLLMLSRNPEKVFWIVSCGKYLWNYFENVLAIKRYFYDVIVLGDLPTDVNREIILKRHRLSGYELEFNPGKEELADRKYKRLNTDKEKQEYLDTVYFKDLHELSKGNISSSLLFWLLSVENIQPNRVFITNDLYFDSSFINLLSEDEIFTLEAIAEIEILTIDEHAEIFNIDKSKSELILLGLKNKGILFRTKEGFQIHFLLYKQVMKMLDNRNILK